MKICLATNNLHKIEELTKVLPTSWEVLKLSDMGNAEDLEETGTTLLANSLQKALYIFDKYKIPCIADDSGLEVRALGGKPGVDSAHYAGSDRNADANMNLVLQQLNGQTDRFAVFKTVLTYVDVTGNAHQFEGIVEGAILTGKQGSHGFGYDPIFMPAGYAQSFAEMNPAEKNAISHRARAVHLFQQYLLQQKTT